MREIDKDTPTCIAEKGSNEAASVPIDVMQQNATYFYNQRLKL